MSDNDGTNGLLNFILIGLCVLIPGIGWTIGAMWLLDWYMTGRRRRQLEAITRKKWDARKKRIEAWFAEGKSEHEVRKLDRDHSMWDDYDPDFDNYDYVEHLHYEWKTRNESTAV